MSALAPAPVALEASRPRPRRWLAPSLVALVVAASVAGATFWYWTTTPVYALSRVVLAFHDRDLPTFEAYVDVDAVVGGVIDELLASGLVGGSDRPADGVAAPSGLAAWGAALVQGLAQLLRPQLVAAAHGALGSYFATGHVTQDLLTRLGPLAVVAGTLFAPDEVRNDIYRGIDSSRVDGDVARVAVRIHVKPLDQDVVVDLEMHRTPERWRVVRLANGAALIQELKPLITGARTGRP